MEVSKTVNEIKRNIENLRRRLKEHESDNAKKLSALEAYKASFKELIRAECRQGQDELFHAFAHKNAVDTSPDHYFWACVCCGSTGG